MNPFTIPLVDLLFVTPLLVIVGLGCNTAHGFGKDVENVGDKIQRGTDQPPPRPERMCGG